MPLPSFSAVAEAAVARRVDFGVLPIESSLVGPVNETHDLLYELPLSIVDETALRIRHCLVGLRAVPLEEIHEVHSHPVALDQCRALLAAMPWTTAVAASTTAAAAQHVADSGRSEGGGNLERARGSAARTCGPRQECGRPSRRVHAVRGRLHLHAPRSAEARVANSLQLCHRSFTGSAPPSDRALRATWHRSRSARLAADPVDSLALPIRCGACGPSTRCAGTRRNCRSPSPGSDAAPIRLISRRRRARGRIGVASRLTRLTPAPTLPA